MIRAEGITWNKGEYEIGDERKDDDAAVGKKKVVEIRERCAAMKYRANRKGLAVAPLISNIFEVSLLPFISAGRARSNSR